jgi:hypothetical protein
VTSKSPNMMSWFRQVFQRSPAEAEASAGGAYDAGAQESQVYESRAYEGDASAAAERGPAPAATPLVRPVGAENTLISRLRRAREGLAPLTDRSPALAAAFRAFHRLEVRLSRPPRLVLLGEFNSGKSTLMSVLLGSNLAPGFVTRVGRVPVLVRYSSRPVLIAVDVNGGRTPVDAEALSQWRGAPLSRVEAGAPSPALRRLELLDLPGDAHPSHDLGDLPLQAGLNAHLAVWCTSATQAWKGSEQRAWKALPARLQSYSLLVATYKDRLGSDADCEKVLTRLRREAAPLFGDILLFSARLAGQSRDETQAVVDPDLWRASGAETLFASLGEALAKLAASREKAAVRVVQRIVSQLQATQDSADAATLLALWSQQAEAAAARITPENVRDVVLLQDLARVIHGFGVNVVEPWLRQRT